jgi:hypothetical protein
MFLEKCECGGEYKLATGKSYGGSPPAHPVVCKVCYKEGVAHFKDNEHIEEIDIIKYAKDYEKGY